MPFRQSLRRAACPGIALTLASAEEGKWTPQQLLQFAAVAEQGLQLPVSRPWDPRAAPTSGRHHQHGGCSPASSPRPACSLPTTTASSNVQEHSRPAVISSPTASSRAVAKTSFPARPCATVPHRFTDVTKEVEPAYRLAPRPGAHQDRVQTEGLLYACEKTPACGGVAAFDGGLQYVLIETIELTDIRLVYAPPRAMANSAARPITSAGRATPAISRSAAPTKTASLSSPNSSSPFPKAASNPAISSWSWATRGAPCAP